MRATLLIGVLGLAMAACSSSDDPRPIAPAVGDKCTSEGTEICSGANVLECDQGVWELDHDCLQEGKSGCVAKDDEEADCVGSNDECSKVGDETCNGMTVMQCNQVSGALKWTVKKDCAATARKCKQVTAADADCV